ncbi:MAG: phage terminase large subunit [Armatimonadota bacterium]
MPTTQSQSRSRHPRATKSDIRPENRPYQPFGTARTMWFSRDPELVLSGPAGTGKSRGILEKLHWLAERYPGMRGLILRKTRASLTESGLVTFEAKVVPEGHPILARSIQRRMRQAYRYPNGSELIVGGMDNPTKVMSTEYDIIYVQEAIELTEDDWESASTRLRNGVMPYQQLIADTNPWTPNHWLKLRADAGVCRMLDTLHHENPVLYDHARKCWTPEGKRYIATLDRLTGARYERLRKGRWVSAEGLVYDGWEPAVHIIDRMPAGWESWRKIRSIDFGYVNAFVCQWWAIDPDERMYRYRELYHTHRLVRDHAQQILALSEGEEIEATVADHDAEDRATLHAEGIETIAAYKSISVGIQAVQQRLQTAGDGRPRLYILRDGLVEQDEQLLAAKRPISTVQEIDGYAWPKKKDKDGKPVKELPAPSDDHGLDAMRYAVAYVDGLAGGGTSLVSRAPEPTEEAKAILEQATGYRNMLRRRQMRGG